MPDSPPAPRSLGELRRSGYRSRSIREELRANLLGRLRAGKRICEGVLGYDDTVFPALMNALLCGHDLIFLGERGQAKTRMIRSLVSLLDEWLPEVAGSEIHDDPFAPVSAAARASVAEQGDDAEIAWVHRGLTEGSKAEVNFYLAAYPEQRLRAEIQDAGQISQMPRIEPDGNVFEVRTDVGPAELASLMAGLRDGSVGRAKIDTGIEDEGL